MKPLIVCAGKNELFSFATSIGVGLVEASAGLTQLCLEKKPEKLVFIGTCGIYKRALGDFDGVNFGGNFVNKNVNLDKNSAKFGQKFLNFNKNSQGKNSNQNSANFEQNFLNFKENLQNKNSNSSGNLNINSHDFSPKSQEIQSLNLLEIYETRHAFNVEASSFLGDFYSPAACEINLNVSYETKKCNSSNYICADERVAARFAAMGLELENMEAFAVLSVAAKFGVEAVCFLCATNFCDSQAHQNFIKNHTQAKKNLENFLQEKNLI